MARNLDVALLRAFVTVVDSGGMTAAGARLNLTQAAISQQLKRLEEMLGAELVSRERRAMRLTSAGERLFGRAKRLLALNDDIWAEMTTPLHEGEIRLGIPADIVNTYLPTFLKRFAQTYPKVQVSLICASSAELLDFLQSGKVDLILTTEPECGAGGETLAIDRLVWVGARGGEAAFQRPLPVSIGCSDCAFRGPIREVLQAAGIEWRSVSEITNADAQVATTAADIAVSAFMATTVPPSLDILGPESGLPHLPPFMVNLYLPKDGGTDIARELAHHIRDAIVERHRMAA